MQNLHKKRLLLKGVFFYNRDIKGFQSPVMIQFFQMIKSSICSNNIILFKTR